MAALQPRAIGRDLVRRDGRLKVTGTAPFAYEGPLGKPAYCHLIQATIALGRLTAMDITSAQTLDGVITVLTADSAERLASTEDKELAVLQSDEIAFRGQIIGAVIAETSEVARHAAALVRVTYVQQPHDVELSADRADLYKPDKINPSYPTDTEDGDVAAAMASAPITVQQTYTTAMYHNNPMEPHATTACWDGSLILWDSSQGVHSARATDRERVRAG